MGTSATLSAMRDELPRVMLRADAGSSIGFGHFVRTSALAAYLRNDFRCVIASFNPDGLISDYQKNLVKDSGAEFLPLTAADIDTADAIFLNAIEKSDIVVLDNYYFSTSYQHSVREKAHALVCIDDVHDRHFVADAVMTFCPLSRSDFSLEPYTRFYGGMEWSFLREPFLQPRIARKANEIKKQPRVVMAIGGADPYRLTDRMIGLVTGVIPDVNLDVIAGPTVETCTPESDKLHIWRRMDANGMASIFDKADWGIFPASTVCVEAFSRGLPVAAGFYVDNQKEIYSYGVREGWFAPLGYLLDSPEQIALRLENAMESPALNKSPDFDFLARKKDIVEVFKSLQTEET
ncbi:MAG: pseudaminic acid biosynthesis protein PseG [Muribaculaceae bacterium]|nr:pseudaminic acid biosynthesis protein PseG [Muribaculaceae bacterium]